MLSPLELFLFLLAAGVAWFGWSSLKIRELANRVAVDYCRRAEVQFLDGSVGFGSLSLLREGGRVRVRRVYVFDYALSSVERRQGAILFVGDEFRNLVLLDS